MKFTLLIALIAISINASAQFWQKKEKEEIRFPALDQATYLSKVSISPATVINKGDVQLVTLKRSDYTIELAENIVMREAKHHMRFREYNTASYDFSALAKLYIQQHRYSEAKWYLLQSNLISRGQNDDKHTIANLLDLAGIKAAIGEIALARVDLKEAQQIANLKGLTTELPEIEKRSKEIELTTNPAFLRSQFRYAAAVEAAEKAKNKQ